jgi:D-alanyl-D-alanine carboxypeptidase
MTKNIRYFLGAFFLTLFLFWSVSFLNYGMEKYFYAQITEPFQSLAFVDLSNMPERSKPDIEAESAASIRINKSGKQRFVFRKRTERLLPIASLSKLMTALIVVENNPDLSQSIIVSKNAESKYNVPVYGNLEAGQEISLEKLLKLMLHYSSNDAAFALAESVGLESFIAEMNRKAVDLGMEDTHFINPSGLDPEDEDSIPNYSTAYDLIILSKYILKNHPFLLELSLENGPYSIENGVSDLHVLPGQRIIGGKTGYTEKAGGCMLFMFSDEKQNYFINIILGSESPQKRVEEMQKLVNWINS